MTLNDLKRRVVSKRIPKSEEYRTYFGRSLDMARIENAIRHAEFGHMVAITDLESETLSLDGYSRRRGPRLLADQYVQAALRGMGRGHGQVRLRL